MEEIDACVSFFLLRGEQSISGRYRKREEVFRLGKERESGEEERKKADVEASSLDLAEGGDVPRRVFHSLFS